MAREREIEELEAALAKYVTHRGLDDSGAGALLRALPGGLRRTVRARISFARKRRRSRPVRAAREAAVDLNSWHPVSEPPVARYESMAAVLGERLFAFSGFGHRERVDPATFVYLPEEDTWETRAAMPVPVTHAAVAVAGNRVWLIGGYIGDHPGVATSRVQIYDAATDSWDEGPPLPAPRGSVAGAESGGRAHLFGGTSPDRHTDETDHFVVDMSRTSDGWESAAPMPEPRNHLAGAALDGIVYAVGGQRGHDRGATDSALLHAYDPVAGRWQRRADLPTSRSHCEAAVFPWNGHLYVAGGYDDWRDLAPHSNIIRYSPVTDRWEEVGFLPVPLIAPIARVVGDIVVLSSGSESLLGRSTTRTWVARNLDTVLVSGGSGVSGN